MFANTVVEMAQKWLIEILKTLLKTFSMAKRVVNQP